MRTLLLGVLGAAALVSSPAYACRDSGAQRQIFHRSKPLWAPAGDAVLRVRVQAVRSPAPIIGDGRCAYDCRAEAQVLEVIRGPRPGAKVTVRVSGTSCGPWISTGDEGYLHGPLSRSGRGWVLTPRSESLRERARRAEPRER